MPKRKPGLTDRERAVLDFIIRYKTVNDGNSPTIREIGDVLWISSNSLVSHYLTQLQKAGYIRRSETSARYIELVGGRYTYEENHDHPDQ